ncbi:unnamed protein product, partial [Chrysoparadoxa australica]
LSTFIETVRTLIRNGDVRVSEHGYDELSRDGLSAREVLAGVPQAIVVEEYPDFPKGPCALFLQADRAGAPIHVVWGIPQGHDKPVVLITAYRPDPARWDEAFMQRR